MVPPLAASRSANGTVMWTQRPLPHRTGDTGPVGHQADQGQRPPGLPRHLTRQPRLLHPLLDRRHHHSGVVVREPHPDRGRAVVPPPHRHRCEVGYLCVGGVIESPQQPAHPLELIGVHLLGQLHQLRLVRRVRYPAQRPHLRVRQPARGELGGDQRQPGQGVGYPQLSTGCRRRHRQSDRQPVGARPDPPPGPPLPSVELAQQQQPPAQPGRQLTSQPDQLLLNPSDRNLAQRHAHKPRIRSGVTTRETFPFHWRRVSYRHVSTPC